MTLSSQQQEWKKLANAFGLDVVIPFELNVGSDRVEIPVLLRGFGASKGMLICEEYSTIQPHTDVIGDLGYGFSCVTLDIRDAVEHALDVKEMLEDWGWTGPGAPPQLLAQGHT